MAQWQLKHKGGEVYPSEVIAMEMLDARSLRQLGQENNFYWSQYFQPEEPFQAYKLLVIGNSFIQGVKLMTSLKAYQVKRPTLNEWVFALYCTSVTFEMIGKGRRFV